MTAHATTLGSVVSGVIAQNTSGDFYSIPAGVSGQALTSIAPNDYAFASQAGTSSNGCIQQIVSVNPNSTIVAPTLTVDYSYNPAALFTTVTITPTSTTSTFYALFSATMNMSPMVPPALVVTVAGFLGTASPSIVLNWLVSGTATTGFTQQTGGSSLGFQTGTLTPFDVNFCLFTNLATTSTAIAPNDAFTIVEVNSTSLNTALPVFTSTSATPVLAVQIPSTAVNTSTMVTGSVWVLDMANANSGTFNYAFVMQQGASLGTAPTIGSNTVIVNATSGATSLVFAPVVGFVNISFIGLAGSTFLGQQSFTTVS